MVDFKAGFPISSVLGFVTGFATGFMLCFDLKSVIVSSLSSFLLKGFK